MSLFFLLLLSREFDISSFGVFFELTLVQVFFCQWNRTVFVADKLIQIIFDCESQFKLAALVLACALEVSTCSTLYAPLQLVQLALLLDSVARQRLLTFL